jgi:hypothetical protein
MLAPIPPQGLIFRKQEAIHIIKNDSLELEGHEVPDKLTNVVTAGNSKGSHDEIDENKDKSIMFSTTLNSAHNTAVYVPAP